MKRLKALLLSALLFNLVGCVEFTSQICTQARLADVPSIEGPKSLRVYNEEFGVDHLKFDFVRKSQGVYSSSGGGMRFRSCRLGRHILAETGTEFGTYMYEVLKVFEGPGFYSGSLAVDREELELNEVPYSIEKRSIEVMSRLPARFGLGLEKWFPQQGSDVIEVLVVDNSEVEASTLEKLSWTMSLGMILEK